MACCLLLAMPMAAASPGPSKILASDPLVHWIGRTATGAELGTESPGSVYFDWEGVSASVDVANYTWLTVQIADECPGNPGAGGGSRWAVTMTTSDTFAAGTQHRIQTFYSASQIRDYVVFNLPGGWASCNPYCNKVDGNTTRFTLTRLTEGRLSGCTATQNLSVVSFATDGGFGATPPVYHHQAGPAQPPPVPAPRPTRRLEFIGDSISAGDLDDGGSYAGGGHDTICANGAYNDDILYSTGGVLCSYALGFDAECMYSAWGGIQLGGMTVGGQAHWGMVELYPNTFGGDGAGPAGAYRQWNFSKFPADGVVVNLGTNGGWRANATNDYEAWRDAYVQLVTDIVMTHYKNPKLPVFCAYGPMSTAYETPLLAVIATLQSRGIAAHALDLTLPHSMTGCYGHPSHDDHVEIAAKAKGKLAAVLGWN